MRALCLIVALLSAGCSSALLERGGIYYIVWPSADPDYVEIGDSLGEGWYQCASLAQPGTGIWSCNLNTAVYFVRVRPREHPPTPSEAIPEPSKIQAQR